MRARAIVNGTRPTLLLVCFAYDCNSNFMCLQINILVSGRRLWSVSPGFYCFVFSIRTTSRLRQVDSILQ